MPDQYDVAGNTENMSTTNRYEPSVEETRKLKMLNGMFQAAKKAKSHKIKRWRRNEELYNGDFFKPFNLPKYKSRIVANTIHSTLETIYSILTDRFPKVDIMPKREDQIKSARIAQDAVDSELDKRKAGKAINMMKRDGLLYGNGFVKVIYNEGKASFVVPDVYTVFFDPLATDIDNAKYVTFATPTYLKDVRKMFENGKFVKPEGSMDEYRSFIRDKDDTEDSISQVTTASGGNTGVSSGMRTDYVSKSPAYDQSEEGKGVYGGQVLLKECWFWEGDKLMLATWAGKVLLQLVESPYEDIPLVMFKNYADAHHLWGKGEPEIIESLSVGTAILLSQGIDNIIYHGNPAMIMSKSLAKEVGNRPSDKPGKVYYTNGPHEQIQRLDAGNMSSSTLPMSQTLMQMTDTVSGVHDITQGRSPSGVTASRAIQQLQEASQQVIRAKEREVGTDAILDLYKLTLKLLHRNYEEAISVRKFAQDGAGYEFEQVMPYDIDSDMDFKYVPGSSLPESRASRMDQAMDLIQMGLLDQEKFWRWTQKDISQEILDEILEQKKLAVEQMQKDMQTMQQSTDPAEIENAQLRLREGMGFGRQQTEEE